jgi:hypothetical protein
MATTDGLLGRRRRHRRSRRALRQGQRPRHGSILQSPVMGNLVALCRSSRGPRALCVADQVSVCRRRGKRNSTDHCGARNADGKGSRSSSVAQDRRRQGISDAAWPGIGRFCGPRGTHRSSRRFDHALTAQVRALLCHRRGSRPDSGGRSSRRRGGIQYAARWDRVRDRGIVAVLRRAHQRHHIDGGDSCRSDLALDTRQLHVFRHHERHHE